MKITGRWIVFGAILSGLAIFWGSAFEDIGEWDLGETITGDQLILKSSHSEVQLDGLSLNVRIETFPENKENLVGRGLLNRFFSQINGFRNEFCCSTTPE